MTAVPLANSALPALAPAPITLTRTKAKSAPAAPAKDNEGTPSDFKQNLQDHLALDQLAGKQAQPNERHETPARAKQPQQLPALVQQATSKGRRPTDAPLSDAAAAMPASLLPEASAVWGPAAAIPSKDEAPPSSAGAQQSGEHSQPATVTATTTGATNTVASARADKNEAALAVRVTTGATDAAHDKQTEFETAVPEEALSTFVETGARTAADAKSFHESGHENQDGESAPPFAAESGAPSETAPAADNAGTTATAANTRASDFEAELARFRPEPVRGAHVQITGAENQRIDIRMVERGGALALTVRTADHLAAKTLQEHAPELESRLAGEHYRTELWTPTASKLNDTADFANGNRNPGGEGQGTNAGRNGQGGENRKGKQQPAWLESFEDQAKAIQQRIEYTWHQ